MATTSLLEAIPSTRKSKLQTLNWNPLLQTIPTQLPLRSTKHTAALINSLKFSKKGSYFTVKCIANSINSNIGVEEKRNNAFSFDRVVEVVLKALKALQKPAITAVMLGLLLMYDPHAALAASGGRMGGSSFSSHSSSSSSSSSGDYGDYFTKSSSPSYIYSKSSSPSYIYSAPYYAASPFGFTGGGGGGLYSGTEGVAITGGGGGWLYSEPASVTVFLMCLVPLFVFLSGRSEGSVLTATQKTSVIKIQVGLLGMARSLQRDLDRIAEVADTSTSEGLSYVLTETTLALLRQPDCCISGYSSVDIKNSTEDGENRFNHLSIEERGKFDEETLVNVNNIKRKGSRSRNGNGFSNEYIVITILVAAEGVTKLPYINSSADLKEALQKLASIPASKTMAVEVLWTPQNENDILTERQLLEDYPLLMPL